MADWLRGNERMVMNVALMSEDINFDDFNENHRRVIIVNPNDAVNLELMDYVSALNGTGHSEWEYMLAFLLVNSIRRASAVGDEADISRLFDRSFTASGNRKMTADQILKHCLKLFTIVEDRPDILKVKIKAA